MEQIDIGELCTYCGRDTSFGSVDENGKELLLRVNRIRSTSDGWKRGEDIIYTNDFPEDLQPDKFSDSAKAFILKQEDIAEVELVGYQCVECQLIECDQCNEMVLDYEIIDDQQWYRASVICESCHERNIYRKEEEGE